MGKKISKLNFSPLKKLHSMTNDCIEGPTTDNDLHRLASDPNWLDREVMQEHVLFQLACTKLEFILSCEMENTQKTIHTQIALRQLIDNRLKGKFEFGKHFELCMIIERVIQKCKDTLSDKTCQKIFNFILNTIKQHKDKKLILEAFCVLHSFPFEKHQSCLLKLINLIENRLNGELMEWNGTLELESVQMPFIDSVENQLNIDNCDLHRNLCVVIREVLCKFKDLLSDQICARIFDYLVKLIDLCDHEETFNFAGNVLREFPFNKYQPLLGRLVNAMEDLLNSNICYRVEKLWIFQEILVEWEDMFTLHIREQMLNYLVMLICERLNGIDVLKHFPFHKFQSSLVELCDSAAKQLKDKKCDWDNHWKLSSVIQEAFWRSEYFFRGEEYNLSKQTYRIMFDYIWKLLFQYDHWRINYYCACPFRDALQQFSFNKHHSQLKKFMIFAENWHITKQKTNGIHAFHTSIAQKCDSAAKQLKNKVRDWNEHWTLCNVIQQAFAKCHFSLSQQTCAAIFNYLVMLIDQCDHEKTSDCAWKVLEQFPFNKYHVQQMLDSLVKLIGKMNYSLRHFPFNLAVKQLKHEQCDWNSHWELLTVIREVMSTFYIFSPQYKSFNQQTCDQILHYIVKLLELCDHMETVDVAWTILLEQFPLKEYKSIWTKLIDLAETHLNGDLDLRFNRHKKLCEALEKQLTYGDSLNRKIFDYLTKLIVKCKKSVQSASEQVPINKTHLLMQLMDSNQSIVKQVELILECGLIYNSKIMLDRFKGLYNLLAMIEYLKHAQQDQLFEPLYNSKSQYSHDLPNDFDFVKYRSESCAHMKNMNEPGTAIILLPDRFGAMTMARKDRDGFAPVRSPFYVTSGIYFYEVILVTDGKMQFGWSTREERFDRWEDGDECGMWVCFDVKRKCVRHNGKQWNISNRTECRAGDVIGCLIDFDEQRFVFYYNGQTIKCSSEIHFSTLPYYATARLSLNQQCYFNFGQVPFMFAPDYIQFSNFIKASESEVKRCQLVETGICNSRYSNYWMYWFKHSTVDNRVYVTFSDQVQRNFDKMMKSADEKIRDDREFDEKWFLKIRNVEADKRWRTLRLIQSIIEVMKGGEKVDVMAMWIGRIIEDEIDEVWCEKILELINPYLELRINSSKDLTKHRNICIVLIHLIMFSQTWYRDFLDDIHSEVFTYLTRTLTDTTDLWTQLFAIIALTNLKLTEGEKRLFRENDKISQILNLLKDNIKCKNIGKFLAYKNYAPILVQLHFVSEHFLNINFNPSIVIQPNPVALNPIGPNDRTAHLKLSADQLTARSDWKWQSVRSVCCVEKGICFFEAVLLSNGPMRIGWSTQRTNLEKTEIGGDQFSIAFDGYNRCVWHNAVKLDLETRLQPWKAGDVIGCLIEELTKENNQKVRQFSFYLNSQLISYKSSIQIYSSINPYHASISLDSHQQVWLNFGQVDFKFAPQRDFLSFYHYPQHKLVNHQAPITLHNIINSLVLLNSNNTITGNVALKYHALNEMIENTLEKGLTFECITCPGCHKKIHLKHFFTECCVCLKLQMDKQTENELPSITSAQESPSNTPELTVATL